MRGKVLRHHAPFLPPPPPILCPSTFSLFLFFSFCCFVSVSLLLLLVLFVFVAHFALPSPMRADSCVPTHAHTTAF